MRSREHVCTVASASGGRGVLLDVVQPIFEALCEELRLFNLVHAVVAEHCVFNALDIRTRVVSHALEKLFECLDSVFEGGRVFGLTGHR